MTTMDTQGMVVPRSPDSIINELIYEGKILGTMTTIGKNGARFVAVHNIADRFHTGYGDHPDEAKANADELVLKHLIAQNSLSHQQLASYALYRLGKEWPTVAVITSNVEQGDLRTRLDELYWDTLHGKRSHRSPDSVCSESTITSKRQKHQTVAGETPTDPELIQPTAGVNGAATIETEETGSVCSEKPIKRSTLPPNADEMHPSILLTHLRPGLRIDDRRADDGWIATVEIDGQEFCVNAETKKEARMLVCKYVCQQFFGVDSKFTLNGGQS
ncbi:uncharacterized protein LOC5667306 isoform X2 [Anopheles gambiae]|uniref:uncharacterized protein LOC5667306 isoform X2 n=1 Tax=Anopheles gambiae TaxID=7165 RepID=UPI002AC976B9|nr:uncharacterized protein LOC5667306 isoform X2 [Anopheles gambiae]